jgi:hypothetical protein
MLDWIVFQLELYESALYKTHWWTRFAIQRQFAELVRKHIPV